MSYSNKLERKYLILAFTFPPLESFKAAFHSKLKGKFIWNLKNPKDAFSANKLGYKPNEKWTEPEQFYKDLQAMVTKGDNRLKDQVHYILDNMGF